MAAAMPASKPLSVALPCAPVDCAARMLEQAMIDPAISTPRPSFAGARIALFQLRTLGGGHRSRQRKIVILFDQRLPLLAEDEGQKLLHERREGLARLAIDIDVEVALERISPAGDITKDWLTENLMFVRQCQRFDLL